MNWSDLQQHTTAHCLKKTPFFKTDTNQLCMDPIQNKNEAGCRTQKTTNKPTTRVLLSNKAQSDLSLTKNAKGLVEGKIQGRSHH